ncbi:methyltransferase domain-containing protein [Curtobacterium sp. Leaf261]|uniref:methyltransferase domain-containing protein n=1 Tax=Curtobacterium sp. Leaf261 TaxID=1736311 RepID=UPI0006F68CB2|nr:methyltransferase domain-containing protein [Curtobacterium sp. Leaf261]KQO61426.1 trans-aconitate methyltransferase [Curtobacterium sp. Leaf261]
MSDLDRTGGSPTWDPAQYAAFSGDRSRPFHDLVAQVGAVAPRRVVDLGCGPGTLTATLADRWPDAEVIGIDSSSSMLDEAASVAADRPNLRFERGEIADWRPDQRDDVVVTNAALQWVPSHRELLPTWLSELAPGAWFAMQVPGNFASPSHALMRSIAARPPFAHALDGVLRSDPVSDAPGYLETFLDAGFDTTAWETTYMQVLRGEEPVLEWTRGTGLRPALQALDAADPTGALTRAYEREYGAALRLAYPASANGTVYPFRRIFAVGRRR